MIVQPFLFSFFSFYFTAVDSRYSPEVFHETSYIGGNAVFKCLLANAVIDHVSLISWSLKWQTTNKEEIIGNGKSNGRFRVLKGLSHLVVSNVEKEDNDLRVRCTTKDLLNGIVLTSSDAYLFVQGEYFQFLDRVSKIKV